MEKNCDTNLSYSFPCFLNLFLGLENSKTPKCDSESLHAWKTVRATFLHTVVSQSRGDCSMMWKKIMDPGSESAMYAN